MQTYTRPDFIMWRVFVFIMLRLTQNVFKVKAMVAT